MKLKILEGALTEESIKAILDSKTSLRKLYLEAYQEYSQCIAKSPPNGLLLECGSGLGFAEDIIPGLFSSDIKSYSSVDIVLDATKLPFKNASTSAIMMHNVFHHIPDVESFFSEAVRCLKSGGRILISDEYPGIFAKYIYKYIHFEHFDHQSTSWSFPSDDPLIDANGALAWIVFVRDIERFRLRFPKLKLERFTTHTPLRYWLCGGMKRWSLLPNNLFNLASRIDKLLIKVSPRLGSFVYIELVK